MSLGIGASNGRCGADRKRDSERSD